MVDLNETEIVTEPVRIAFPSLFEPKPTVKGGTDLKYQAALLLPPDYDMAPLAAVVKAAMIEKWGKVIKLSPRNTPIKKCEDRETELAGYDEGWRYLNAKSGYQPSVLDPKKQEILDEARVFAGCWCRFHLTAFAWEHAQGGRGVSFSLNSVMLIREDSRLGGRKDARDVFADIVVEDVPVEEGVGEDELDDLMG